ncbi:hypothetical protein HDZ31DRAFT_28000 [Schizophyllum fasciatum]
MPSDANAHIPRSPKGGGGRGGGISKSSGGKNGSKSGNGRGSSSSSKSPPPISIPGSSSRSSSLYGGGGGATTKITSGTFSGRTQGGASRSQVYGSSVYGSGYPGYAGKGVAGRDFPFYYWPITFGGAYGAVHYVEEGRKEYGSPSNSSRPGGVLTKVSFTSASGNTTLWVIADNSTTISLVDEIHDKCASLLSTSTSRLPVAYSDTPRAESVVQYYRASSVALALDGYNNTAALTDDDKMAATPLPGWRNTDMLRCLNDTIGAAVPLVDADGHNNGAALGAGVPGTIHAEAAVLMVVLFSLLSPWV